MKVQEKKQVEGAKEGQNKHQDSLVKQEESKYSKMDGGSVNPNLSGTSLINREIEEGRSDGCKVEQTISKDSELWKFLKEFGPALGLAGVTITHMIYMRYALNGNSRSRL